MCLALHHFGRGTLFQVNDLREEFAGEMLDALRAVLSMFGVQVMNVRL